MNKQLPIGEPQYFARARDVKGGGYYVRFIDEEGTNRPYYVETLAEAKRIVAEGK